MRDARGAYGEWASRLCTKDQWQQHTATDKRESSGRTAKHILCHLGGRVRVPFSTTMRAYQLTCALATGKTIQAEKMVLDPRPQATRVYQPVRIRKPEVRICSLRLPSLPALPDRMARLKDKLPVLVPWPLQQTRHRANSPHPRPSSQTCRSGITPSRPGRPACLTPRQAPLEHRIRARSRLRLWHLSLPRKLVFEPDTGRGPPEDRTILPDLSPRSVCSRLFRGQWRGRSGLHWTTLSRPLLRLGQPLWLRRV